MDFYSELFYSINIGLSSLNLVVLFLFVIVFSGTTFHINLKLLMINLLVSSLCIATSNFLSANIHLNYFGDEIFRFTNRDAVLIAISNYGVNLAPLTFLALLIERALATVYSRIYERLHSLTLQLTLVLSCHFGAVVMGFCFNYLKISYYYQAILNSSIDFLCIIAMILLYAKNTSLRHIDFYSDIELSQRFQVTENIRAIYLFLPLTFFGVLFSFSSSVAGSIQLWISSTSVQLRNPINHLMMNFYISCAFLITLRQDRPMRRRFKALVFPCARRINKMRAEIAPKKGVRNVFGDRIVDHESTDKHFNTLHWMWNKGPARAAQ